GAIHGFYGIRGTKAREHNEASDSECPTNESVAHNVSFRLDSAWPERKELRVIPCYTRRYSLKALPKTIDQHQVGVEPVPAAYEHPASVTGDSETERPRGQIRKITDRFALAGVQVVEPQSPVAP